MDDLQGARIHIDGVVQGVGFRPFVYGLATRLSLTGWVRNTSAGVDIEVNGKTQAVEEFIASLQKDTPPLARIDRLEIEPCSLDGFLTFEILHSEAIPGAFQPISPDVSTCPDCLSELFDPQDRRYRYPFINCTNCGPRFTIIQDIPYDRPNTTMAGFAMCAHCSSEYADPLNRRFHAQPVACPMCGPQVWLERRGEGIEGERNSKFSPDDAILETQRLLAEGKIMAIKGLGGYHLACNAADAGAVAELRRRKLRVDKPFALMMPDLETVEQHCFLEEHERASLESRERPIVILARRPESSVALEVAPGQNTIGVMLPYTPLHYLLFSRADSSEMSDRPSTSELQIPSVLVMTSGNLSEEPIVTDNDEARQRLKDLADAFLMHDRPVHMRCDDSVVRVFPVSKPNENLPDGRLSTAYPSPASAVLRRSRGYAPAPLRLPWELPPILATGAELKNTFALTRDRYVFLSHHIGDLENYETLSSFEQGISHFERLFHVQPETLAYDLHPNYLATRYALERAGREKLSAVGVQHHHAHIVACMAENGLSQEQPVIGVAFDGTGYGEDGHIWGGEFLLSSYTGFKRLAHLAYLPLPGGDAAIRKPARAALAYLWQSGLEWNPNLPSTLALCAEERSALRSQLEHRINTPLTSSMGRLFDVVAALAGVRQKINYEAQAAIELEALVDPEEDGAYPFDFITPIPEQNLELAAAQNGSACSQVSHWIEPAPLFEVLLDDLLAGVPVSTVAARFHNGVATMVLEVCRSIRETHGVSSVALSGGVWQNATLLRKTQLLLQQDEFDVYNHRQVPANDGGLALGQAVIAAHILRSS